MNFLITLRAFVSMFFIAVTTFIGSLIAYVCRLFDPSGESVIAVARRWSQLLLWFSGVKMHVKGVERLELDCPYVFMANHLSTVDIWAIYAAFPFRFRMIAKKQLGSIPFFGWAMRAGRFIFIDRTNALAARRSIDLAKERIRDGHRVLIFPEGTRSRDGRLAAFKKGGFHLAMDAGVPIVPVAIIGSGKVMPPGSYLLRPGRVEVVVCEPIPTADLTEVERGALIERVRGRIAEAIGDPVASPPLSTRAPAAAAEQT